MVYLRVLYRTQVSKFIHKIKYLITFSAVTTMMIFHLRINRIAAYERTNSVLFFLFDFARLHFVYLFASPLSLRIVHVFTQTHTAAIRHVQLYISSWDTLYWLRMCKKQKAKAACGLFFFFFCLQILCTKLHIFHFGFICWVFAFAKYFFLFR